MNNQTAFSSVEEETARVRFGLSYSIYWLQRSRLHTMSSKTNTKIHLIGSLYRRFLIWQNLSCPVDYGQLRRLKQSG